MEAELLGADEQGLGEFFAPVSTDLIETLVAQYRTMRARIEAIAEMVTGETAGAITYFLQGNSRQERYGIPGVDQLFKLEGAIGALNSAYWSKALALTDVLDCMPQQRRDEWHESITKQTTPDFVEITVRSTLGDLLVSRSRFFAERVDGIFKGLSREHVTNSPVGFGKRMILGYVLNGYGGVGETQAGRINDLRSVIAKIAGRDEPKYFASSNLIYTLRGRWGEWVSLDGGAIRIRLYKKGTAHLEVHPDIAWRLNQVLSSLYPAAIPSEFRTKPAKRFTKAFKMMQQPLPFEVLGIISGLWRREKGSNVYSFRPDVERSSAPYKSAVKVLAALGGCLNKSGNVEFDYDPSGVWAELETNGCIPDQKAHQFYPTPENVAAAAIDLAEIGPGHLCLEPSAGQGGLSDFMPDRTTCVEVSPLHCKILEAKGSVVICADFLAWAESTAQRFDRVVMNPPFSQGRAEAHVNAAAKLVNKGGRLVAILPSSFRGKFSLPGFDVTWSRVYTNEFAGTSTSVVILVSNTIA